MSGTAWAALPKVVQVRQAALAVLKAAPTLLGATIEDTPLQDWTDDQLPAIEITSELQRDPRALAGTTPGFDVNCTLRVQVTTGSADGPTTVAACDVLEAAVLDALFGDPVWLGLVGPIRGIQTTNNRPRMGEIFRVQALHAISLRWIETYSSNQPTALTDGGQPIGVPYKTQPAWAPLTLIDIADVAPDGTTPVSADIPLSGP